MGRHPAITLYTRVGDYLWFRGGLIPGSPPCMRPAQASWLIAFLFSITS